MSNNTQPTVTELLARLNSLRADVGKTPLASWKEGRIKLETAIHNAKVAAQTKLDEKVASAEKVTQCPPMPAKGATDDQPHTKQAVKGLKTEKKTKAAKPAKAKAAKTPKATDGNTVTLADIARELNINPKVARAKARRHEKELGKLRIGDEGWTFPTKARADVVKILKG